MWLGNSFGRPRLTRAVELWKTEQIKSEETAQTSYPLLYNLAKDENFSQGSGTTLAEVGKQDLLLTVELLALCDVECPKIIFIYFAV